MRCAYRYHLVHGAVPPPDEALGLRGGYVGQCFSEARDGSNFCESHRALIVDRAIARAPRTPGALVLGIVAAVLLGAIVAALPACAAPTPDHIAPADCFIWVVDRDGRKTCLEERPRPPLEGE